MAHAKQNIREHYAGDRLVLPELTAFGWDLHPQTIHSLGAHVHPRAYEICYLVAGSVEWWAGPEVYQVNRGDIYITRPGERHGGVDSMMHPCELFFFQIHLPTRTALPGLSQSQTRGLARHFRGLRHRCFPGSTPIAPQMQLILDAHRRPTTLSIIKARAALHQILVTVLEDHEHAVSTHDQGRSAKVQAALQWMDGHDEEDYRVEDVAAAVNLGVSRFHELFLSEVGFTPNDYRLRRRVARAKTMLRDTDRPVTDIAMRLGFSSSQYFATVFKKLSGMTPQAYRQRTTTPEATPGDDGSSTSTQRR